MSTSVQTKPRIKVFLVGGLIAGLVAAILNNVYAYVYTAFTGVRVPEIIHVGSITGASVLPAVIASLVYFALTRFTPKAQLLFILIGIAFTVFSFGGPLQNQLPDGSPTPPGFAGLTLPMHIIAAVVVLYVLIKYVHRAR